jgi:hypothetical protein
MRSERRIPALKRGMYLLLLCAAILSSFPQAAQSQSGRRQPSKTVVAPPPSATEAETRPEAKTPATKPTFGTAAVIVGGDRIDSSLYLLSSYVDDVIRACVDRLGETSGLEVAAGGHMTRKDAIDRAKKEAKAYVLWIELRPEEDGRNELSISYQVYNPQTAKVLTTGRVHPGNRSAGSGGVIIGVPSVTRRLPLQYQLKEGGREIADRVRSKLAQIDLK